MTHLLQSYNLLCCLPSTESNLFLRQVTSFFFFSFFSLLIARLLVELEATPPPVKLSSSFSSKGLFIRQGGVGAGAGGVLTGVSTGGDGGNGIVTPS